MTYSIIGILAAAILLISNRDILRIINKDELTEVQKNYRNFLYGVLAYYITDALWGILDAQKLTFLLFLDTSIHFLAMVAAVMLWSQYVISYLDNNNRTEKVLDRVGKLFFLWEVIVVIVNIFYPLLFWLDENGDYHAGIARYITLAAQILLFLITAVYTLQIASRHEGRKSLRNQTIGLFGISMVAMISIQMFYPLLPFYSMGYLIGTTVLHSYVMEDEKEDYRRELEEALKREKLQKEELSESREALKDALAQAEEANKAKTAFLSNMSHEIRTPMNAIIGLNNIAMNDPSASEQIREYTMKIDSAAQHLLGIINEILDMSRIEAGRMAIKKEEFSFAKALEQVNTMISDQCREKGLDYECRIVGKVNDYYIGDAMKLKQVLINILGNAVKFTPEGGKVSFVIEEGPRMDGMATLKFTVSDTGIGMSKEYLPHIFEVFSLEDDSTTSRYGSTGLGMPITKNIVELMNGNIEVESEKGKGSTFTITVTLSESDRKRKEEENAGPSGKDMSVLVIDDDNIALEHARIVLGQAGANCDTAGSGQEGIDKVSLAHSRREDYDLILIDWKMPDLDGVETVRRIREIVGDQAVIILTTFNWDEIADEAREAGVDSFTSKPLFAGAVMDEFHEAYRLKNDDHLQQKVDLRGRRILLAEDAQINAEIISMILKSREIEVDHAENGRIALEYYEKHDPYYYDAILMDMRMPEMDGLEATRRIRTAQRADSTSIPVIALTANAFDEDVQRSMQAGLNAHLTKPIDADVLFETLEELLKSHSMPMIEGDK